MKGLSTYRFPFAKYPAIRMAVLMAAGIVIAKYLPLAPSYWFGMLGLILAMGFTVEWLLNRALHKHFVYLSTGCFLLGLMVFGAAWQSLFSDQREPASRRLLAAYTWQHIEVKGTIYNINPSASGKYQLDVAVDSTMLEDSLHWVEPYDLRAVYDPEHASLPERMKLGARIDFKATVYPLESKRNPYQFDYKSYLASQHIHTQVGVDSVITLRASQKWLSWNILRQKVLAMISRNFNGSAEPLAKALLMGYKNELGRNEKVAFSRAGLAHIMAVSGLHVGFLLAPFWFFIPFLWAYKYGKQAGLLFLMLLLFVYAGLTGFSPSVMRASIAGGLLAYGRLFHKAGDSKNLMAVAAIIILLLNPNELFSIGFQLSFAAVYIILLVLPVLRKGLPEWVQHRWYGAPLMVILVSMLVQVGLYPLLSYYFGEFSLIGPLANAFTIPFLGVMIPYALFLIPFSALFPHAGFWLNAPCRWFFVHLQNLVLTMASWHWSWIQTHHTGVFIFLIWLAALIFLATIPVVRLRWKMLIVLLGILCLQQGFALRTKLQPPLFRVTMLDVGQGDATLITTPGGKHFLIDTGRWAPHYNSAHYVILPHLKALGVHKLDAIFLSHPHADHIGGMVELINTMPIDTIYNSGSVYDSQLYRNYLKDAAKHHIPVRSLHAGTIVPLDRAMRIYIYGPSAGNHQADVNEHSLIEELVYGKTQWLFMGDAGSHEEHNLVQHFGSLIDTDFLKVGHHGSRTSSSTAFLKVATPAFSAVSLGKHNRFHHPNVQAVRRLEQTGTKLYFTSLRGALEFTSDGSKIHYHKWH